MELRPRWPQTCKIADPKPLASTVTTEFESPHHCIRRLEISRASPPEIDSPRNLRWGAISWVHGLQTRFVFDLFLSCP